jgi:DNA topoisomerase-1
MLKKMDDPVLPEPHISAKEASLVYVSDTGPGIRRQRAGRGFRYVLPGGERLEDFDELARVRKLAIPPAWTDVWISPDPDGHIQATGRDARGRKQYRYHPRWAEVRDQAKYGSLIAFANALPSIRTQIDHDLRRHGLPRERIVASIVWLLDKTMIRVGNDSYARENKSFGLTTLRQKHAELNGSELRLNFKGKSGKEWRLELRDRRVVRVIRSAQELPGQQLFQYQDSDGNRHLVHSDDVNRYIRDASGADFSSKHFRTWGGTIAAAGLLARQALPDSKAAAKRHLNEVVDRVAQMLGNTRSVCRKCYIHPQAIESWLDGRLVEEIKQARRRMRGPRPGLDEEETLVLHWLEMSETR